MSARRILPLLVAGALAAPWHAARADNGLGPAPGNALTPAPINPSTAGRWMDEDGMGTRVPAARTPTGQHYPMPLGPGAEIAAEAEEVEEAARKAGTWWLTGFAELGALAVRGDERRQGFRAYKDVRDGAHLLGFGVAAGQPSVARYFEASGGAAGRRDQFYRLEYGRYNDWRVSAFYDGIPHVTTTTYRSLWSGAGTGTLALASLAPGGTTNAATTRTHLEEAIAAAGDSTLETLRKRAGVRFEKRLSDAWRVHASFTHEKRAGSRAFGAVFGGGGGGGNVEIPESIDYDTSDLVAGLQYGDAASSFNLRASVSVFRNRIDTLTFGNPLFINLNGSNGLSATSFTEGRFDLAPGNEHYHVKAEYARALPGIFRGRFTATAALGSMRQDDALVAPTGFDLAGGSVTAGGVSLANAWNTTAALGRDSADLRLDTRLADFALALKPAHGLDVKGKVRYYETRNHGDYLSCNPLTGQWGRLLNDGSGLSLVTAHGAANPAGTSPNAFNAAGCDLAAVRALGLVPAAGNVPIRSAPDDYRQLTASLSADYRLGRAASVNGLLERETFRRAFRERRETHEDRLKLGYVNRGAIDGTIRLSYEHARRGGGDYNQDAYAPFLSASFGPTPENDGANVASWFHHIQQFRSFDLADRRQHTVNGRIDYAFHPRLDGAFTIRARDADFPARFGRTGRQRSGSATIDLNYQSGPAAVIYGFYSHQAGEMRQRGVHPNSCLLGQTYYFFSDGRVLAGTTGDAPPPTPEGATLVATRDLVAGNWMGACGIASPTSPLFPDSRGWEVSSRDRNHVLGAGIKYDFGRARLDASFTRALGRTRIGYAYNAAGLNLSDEQAALAGDGLADLVFAQNVLSASVLVPIDRRWQLHFLVRHEAGRIRDWHYDGVAENPVPANNAVYLDGGPRDYRATVVGVFVQVRM